METTPYIPTDTDKDIREILRQKMQLPGDLELRVFDQNKIVPGMRKMVAEIGVSNPFWEDVAQLLDRKSVHVHEYKIPADQRVLFAAVASYFKPSALAEYMEIEISTGHKIQQEVAAAIVYLRGKTNIFIGYEDLGVAGQEHYGTFEKVKSKQDEAKAILRDKNLKPELTSMPSFRWLTEAQAKDGSILFYLDKIGVNYEHAVNTSNQFSRFLSEASLQGGNLTLLRRILYASKLNSPSSINFRKQPRIPLLQEAAEWVFNITPEPDRKTGTFKRNIRNFLRYGAVTSLLRNINNYEFLESNLHNHYPLINPEHDNPYGSIDVFLPDNDLTEETRSQLARYYHGDGFFLRLDPARFYLGMQNYSGLRPIDEFMHFYMSTAGRQPAVDHLSQILGMTPSSTRKTYNAALNFCDWLLLSPNIPELRTHLMEDMQYYTVTAGYERIKEKLIARVAKQATKASEEDQSADNTM